MVKGFGSKGILGKDGATVVGTDVGLPSPSEPNHEAMPGKRPNVKNEDQYEALRREGASKEKAARIANTPNAGKKGGHASKYEDRSKQDLYDEAKKIGIEGRSSMSKGELIDALRNH